MLTAERNGLRQKLRDAEKENRLKLEAALKSQQAYEDTKRLVDEKAKNVELTGKLTTLEMNYKKLQEEGHAARMFLLDEILPDLRRTMVRALARPTTVLRSALSPRETRFHSLSCTPRLSCAAFHSIADHTHTHSQPKEEGGKVSDHEIAKEDWERNPKAIKGKGKFSEVAEEHQKTKEAAGIEVVKQGGRLKSTAAKNYEHVPLSELVRIRIQKVSVAPSRV